MHEHSQTSPTYTAGYYNEISLEYATLMMETAGFFGYAGTHLPNCTASYPMSMVTHKTRNQTTVKSQTGL